MTSKLGCHWIRTHPDNQDIEHIEKMEYKSIKLFEWSWNNKDFCRDLLSATIGDVYFLARDHPLSEQKQDMFADPVATGIRHANTWAAKVQTKEYKLPVELSYFLGINEPDATTGDRNAIDRYTVAYLNRLREHGLRGGAFNFSTGHPRTVDGTGNTGADYTVFENSHVAIVQGHHIAVAHIYGTASQPAVPGHYDRLKHCQWPDVEWVIGEMGADEHVVGGGRHDGYLISMASNPSGYCDWLDGLILAINDSRIHSYQTFTYDFSHPWDSFDTRPIRSALESFNWRHTQVAPPKPEPPVVIEPSTNLMHPLPGSTVTQHWGQNGEDYAAFGLWGHNGTDMGGKPIGTPVGCIAKGVVVWSDFDVAYGHYVRVAHKELGCYSMYCHLNEKGAQVGVPRRAGDVVGYLGSSGNSSGPHLHLEIRLCRDDGTYRDDTPMNKGRVDPETWAVLKGLKL